MANWRAQLRLLDRALWVRQERQKSAVQLPRQGHRLQEPQQVVDQILRHCLLAAAVLGEVLTPTQYLGGLLAIGAVALGGRPPREGGKKQDE